MFRFFKDIFSLRNSKMHDNHHKFNNSPWTKVSLHHLSYEFLCTSCTELYLKSYGVEKFVLVALFVEILAFQTQGNLIIEYDTNY
jgi:hypothetical protein